jgi:hypothetical protein
MNDTKTGTKDTKTVPQPGNPLVLVNPMDRSGNAASSFDEKGIRIPGKQNGEKEQGTVRGAAGDPRISGKGKKEIPFFGYDYFEPARKIILARRAYYVQLYKTESDLLSLRSNNGENGNMTTDENGNQIGEDPQEILNNSQQPPSRTQQPLQRPQRPLPIPNDEALKKGIPAGQRQGQTQGGQAQGQGRERSEGLSPVNNRRTPTEENASARTQFPNGNRNEEASYNGIPELSHRRPPTQAEVDAVSGFSNVADPISQLFRNVIASVPDNYQISAGDKLTIRFQSPTLAAREFTTVVDNLGNVDLAGLTKVNLRGHTLDGAQRVLLGRLKTYYKDVDLTINLKELRTITVMVAGNAFSPSWNIAGDRS